MPLSNLELARREMGRLVVRPDPLRLRWNIEDLVSGDGHVLRLSFSCSARAMSDTTEQRLLEEVFLGAADSVTAADVRAHFQGAFRSAASSLCQQKPASEWLANGATTAITDALRSTARKIAFSCGLELLPPFQADLESPTLERQRLEQTQRNLAEQRAVDQVQHFQRATDLLRQFESMRQAAPSLSPGEVLRQINPAEQGMLLQTLMLAAGKQRPTDAVWVVAGPNLVTLDPRQSPPAATVTPLATTLGPLRSVQPAGNGLLLVGARSGVMLLDPNQPTGSQMYVDSAVTSQLGFSRAILHGQQVWACHGEAGIVGWKMGQFEAPFFLRRPPEMAGFAPKNLQSLDGGRMIFSTRNRLMTIENGSEFGPAIQAVAGDAASEIVAVLPDQQRLIVVLRSGVVQVRDVRTLSVVREERRGGDVCAACLMPWLGSTRLLMASDDGPVLCVGLDDDLTTQYLSPYASLRAIAASHDAIAGISPDRQRVLLWQPWNTRQVAADIFITTLARHRAADVDI